ncbi:hypothetical protein Salat_1587400 [Sesamum alatum]|uniref:DUF7806 domain-containing protein n=1 Tax=Sesamum alatum TaxID=300844 RepID=A0AAE1YDE4_9LAMI|nr:hypothetical protein Salat_1587400 [Sesamum alatum]
MEALYAKLYDKYTKLKKEKESQFDKLNHDQEVKFLNYVAAADEMIQYLKTENDRLQGQVDELKSELASIRSSSDEQDIHYKKLLMEEKQKNKELSEEIVRLQKVEHNECSRCTMHEETVGQQNSREDTRGDERPDNTVMESMKKRKFVHTPDGMALPYIEVEPDRSADQHVYGDKGSGAPPSNKQPLCCQKKISSGGDATGTSSVNCVFQYLVELVVGMKISPFSQSNEPCIMAHDQSSGYSFSLTWITNPSGEVELLYRVLSLGTFERVAPEWMKETLIFSTNMCKVFFERAKKIGNSEEDSKGNDDDDGKQKEAGRHITWPDGAVAAPPPRSSSLPLIASAYPFIKMPGCSTSVSTEDQDPNNRDDLPDYGDLSKISEQSPLQHENEVAEENKEGDGNDFENLHEEDDEDEDADFNPFLKETNSAEASSSLSSEVEDFDADIADSSERPSAVFESKEKTIDVTKDCRTSGNAEHGEEAVMQNAVSSGEVCGKKADITHPMTNEKDSVLSAESGKVLLCDKENGLTSQTDVNSAAHSRKPMVDMDTEGAICMRTRARYSLASFTLDELETFLQETDDEDDLQNVDDEEEYRKFLAAVLRGDDSQNLQENANADDEDEENDADFELELEEALESEPEEIEERRMTRRNRRQKASLEHSKQISGQLNRPLRPLLPFTSIGPAFDGKHLTQNIAPPYVPPVNNGLTCGFTPHQIGQLHCLIHEHVQLLIQVFSICVLEPVKSHVGAQVKELIVEMLRKRDQALAWRTVPYPSFCFLPPYVHPSVPDELEKMLPPNDSSKSAEQMSDGRHKQLPDEQAATSQAVECTSWVPYICGPVLSVIDVAPLRLVENYIDEVTSAVRTYERYQIELGFENQSQKEPLFPLHNSPCSAESDGQGELENTPPDSSGALSSSSSNQIPKKTMAATLLEKAKSQSVALVPKEIAKLAQRFWALFNPALFPHKPPPAPLANRVLFTDAEDELLALGLMEYNTDWKAIQQRFLPCKSRHQIFVRQKNRASSKAPENPIKAVRRMKNSPLTSEEIARIELGLKKFKLDWISIWRFFVPYRDPSLLPRQWRIASGTQKSYKSDENKKAKRRLYELKRKTSKPSPSNWHSSSEKEGDSTDNAAEDNNSGDNHMDKEDEAYVHEAFLADWRPDNNISSSFSGHPHSQEGFQAREQNDSSGSRYVRPQYCSKSSAAVKPVHSQVVLRPYRARRPNSARLVKLAPDLPPVNLPPSVRVMSQSAFKSSQAAVTAKVPGVSSRIGGMVAENRGPHAGITMKSGVGSSVRSGPSRNNYVNITAPSPHPNQSEVLIDNCVAERGDSDLQMHPLLFQAPQGGRVPYHPMNFSTSTSSSFTFFPRKQPQLSLSLFHNPRHIRDAVNFLSKSSKTPEKNASSGVHFHPLLQRTDDMETDPVAAHPDARSPSGAESRKRRALIQNPCPSSSKTALDGSSSASGTKGASLSGKVNELDLDIHLTFTSKNQEGVGSRNITPGSAGRSLSTPVSGIIESESAKDSNKKRNSAPDELGDELESGVFPLVTSRNKGNNKVSDDMRDESIHEIIMEQEELSDSEEEFGENVEFEREEMADSEGESTSDSEQYVNIPSEEVQLDEMDADIDNSREVNSQDDCVGNTCSTSDGRSVGLELAERRVNIKPNVPSLNLNSCPPISPHSNPKKGMGGYEFGPFGTTGTFIQNQLPVGSKRSSRHIKPGAGHMKKRAKDAPENTSPTSGDVLPRNPRKRVCRSNSTSSSGVSGKGNPSPNMETSIEKLKNVSTDEFG